MPDDSKKDKAEQDLLAALTKAKKILGVTTPRLLTDKPQIEANALRHGLTGQTVFLTPVQLLDYLTIGMQLIEYLRPTTIRERLVAQRIIDTEWRVNTAISLAGIVHTSTVILESQALFAANPQVDPDVVHTHAQAFAVHQQCSGANTLEKLGRHETRLLRSLRELYSNFYGLRGMFDSKALKEWTCETSQPYLWYSNLADLVEKLIAAREELAESSVEEISKVDAQGELVTNPESSASPESLFCKKTLRLTRRLTPASLETLHEAREKNLLTQAERNLLLFPDAA